MAATLLGGISADGAAIAVGEHLYSVNATSLSLFRYSLPDLTNTEVPATAWASPASGGFTIVGVAADVAGGRVFISETDNFPATTRIYEVDTSTSFPASTTQLATTSGILGGLIAYNPVTDSIWVLGADLYEVPASGGSFTAVDTTFTGTAQGPPSVDPDGNVWATFKSGTTLIIYRWEPDGTRHTVLSETVGFNPGPGLAWSDGTFLFVYDFGAGEEWASITTGGTVSPTDLLDGPIGPYPGISLYRTARVGSVGYVAEDANESGLTTDIYRFGGAARMRVGMLRMTATGGFE